MTSRWFVTFTSVAAVAVATACSGGGGSAPSAPACGAASLESPGPQLLYPIPGTTGVPSTLGIILYTNPSSQAGAITLSSGGSVPVANASPTSLPSPLPSPRATPAVAGAQMLAASFSGLAAGSPVGVYFNVARAGCSPVPFAFGNFQTQ
jgi:hypothetical protein